MTTNKAREIGGREAHGSVAGAIFFLLAGPLLWAGHLTLIYGPQSAMCGFGFAGEGGWRIVLLIVAVTLVALSAQLFLLLRPNTIAALLRYRSAEPDGKGFAYSVSRLLTALSMFGVLWSGATAFALDACAQLR